MLEFPVLCCFSGCFCCNYANFQTVRLIKVFFFYFFFFLLLLFSGRAGFKPVCGQTCQIFKMMFFSILDVQHYT